jgi:FAD/FMN-containing dehydrogenase
MEALLSALRELLGSAHVLTPDADDLSAYEQDWRKRGRGRALAVLRPASTPQVAAVVKLCALAKASGQAVSIVPQGGNTGLVLGSIPDASGAQIVLSLSRMNQVRQIDAANAAITVEAGCLLAHVQQAADDAGLLFPLSLAAEGTCTIGGNLGTNAGGTQVLRYGNTRDLCLGIEWVNAAGEVVQGLSGLRKDNTGYDLRHLLIGSEGTLGIITAATLKLFPKPVARVTAWAQVPGLAAAVQLLGLAQAQLASGLTGFELMNAFSLDVVMKQSPQLRVPFASAVRAGDACFVLLELSDFESEAHARQRFEALVETALERGCIEDAVIAESIAQSKAMWHLRESIPMAQAQEGPNIKHDISLPISHIPEFCEQTDTLLRKAIPHIRLVNFGHLGDGNLHYNVQCPPGASAAAFLVEHEGHINTAVYEQVAKFGGSFSAEHGVGQLKVAELSRYKSPAALAAMQSIKQAMDPQNLFNPGRVLAL